MFSDEVIHFLFYYLNEFLFKKTKQINIQASNVNLEIIFLIFRPILFWFLGYKIKYLLSDFFFKDVYTGVAVIVLFTQDIVRTISVFLLRRFCRVRRTDCFNRFLMMIFNKTKKIPFCLPKVSISIQVIFKFAAIGFLLYKTLKKKMCCVVSKCINNQVQVKILHPKQLLEI